ncbi:hypothetical protein ACQEVZ_30190 [Dactylosporangium sp. CA-152071]
MRTSRWKASYKLDRYHSRIAYLAMNVLTGVFPRDRSTYGPSI